MAVDESFKKQGAVPFKWEIKPGVPKVHQPPEPQHQHFGKTHNHCPTQNTPQKLRPPPSGSYFNPPLEFRTRSFRSVPRTRSERRRFDVSILVQPETVPAGCFPSPLLCRKDDKKKIIPKSESDYELDYSPRARWSFRSRKSDLPLRGSPISSYSSHQSSPRPVSDAEWAGFGLF